MITVAEFARQLAPLIGGTFVEQEEGSRDLAWIDLAGDGRDGLRVVVRTGFGAEATRYRFTMSCTADLRGGADYREVPSWHELETAAAKSRPLDVIARQVEAKIIPPAVEMRAAWIGKRDAIAADKASMERVAAEMRATFPRADVTVEDRAAKVHYRGKSGGYLHGRLQSDGSMWLDRISTLNPSQVARLMAMLDEAEGC